MTSADQSRVAWKRLAGEAAHGLGNSPARSLLAAMGTAVGVGAVVTVLGLTSTANAQIDETFTALSSTSISVELNEAGGAAANFPRRAEARTQRIEGVTQVAIVAAVDNGDPVRLRAGDADASVEPPRVSGVTSGYWDAVGAPLLAGRLIDDRLATEPVAVVGERTAGRLGISDLSEQILITFRGVEFLVIGITGQATRDQVVAGDIAIPLPYVRNWLTSEYYSEQMIVVTRLGAGEAVSRQLPTAISPYRPDQVVPRYTVRPRIIDDAVSSDLRLLFLLLALVSMGIAVLGIVNVSLMSVLERRREIGIRRALGARRVHVVGQFLIEAGLLGLVGGALGGAVGQVVVVAVSQWQGWTPTMEPIVTFAAAPLGLGAGLVAGVYPASRAARVTPVIALRSGD